MSSRQGLKAIKKRTKSGTRTYWIRSEDPTRVPKGVRTTGTMLRKHGAWFAGTGVASGVAAFAGSHAGYQVGHKLGGRAGGVLGGAIGGYKAGQHAGYLLGDTKRGQRAHEDADFGGAKARQTAYGLHFAARHGTFLALHLIYQLSSRGHR